MKTHKKQVHAAEKTVRKTRTQRGYDVLSSGSHTGTSPEQRKKKKETTLSPGAAADATVRRTFAINEVYHGLRLMGHSALSVTGIMQEVSDGFEQDEVQTAAREYGDDL